MSYSIKKIEYLKIYREGHYFIYYSSHKNTFYRYYNYAGVEKLSPNYNIILYNVIFMNIGYWLNSYWQEAVSTMPFITVLFFLCGVGSIYIGVLYAERITKRERRRMMPEECIITDAIIKKGKKWLKTECMILVIACNLPLLLGWVFCFWNHIIWGLLFYVSLFCVGLLIGGIHPVARYKLYKKWEKEIKMQIMA